MNARAVSLLITLLLGAAHAASTHVVQPGDTLSSIARTYHTTPTILRTLNTLQSDVLKPGQTIGLPAAQHTVASGDTLYSIARKHGLSPDALAALNGMTNSTVQIGQILRLPDSTSSAVTGTAQAALPAAPPAPRPVPDDLERGLFTPPRLPMTATPFLRAVSLGARPSSVYLKDVGFEYQTRNNCGPASVAAVLQYYGMEASQGTWQKELRPDGGNMHLPEAQKVLERLGFDAPILRGGTVEDVKRFVAQGIPVIVLQYHQEVGKVPHFRVVRGYDDQGGYLIMSDSLSGANVALTEHDFDVLFNTQGRQYMPVRPS